MITIVSGLPRSGTSLMMQMLVAGGMTALTDGERAADADNPRGYLEGKVVKVISRLLLSLPPSHEYRVIFMRRPMSEVLASQDQMLRRRRNFKEGGNLGVVAAAFEKHLKEVYAWLDGKQYVASLCVEYHDVLARPLELGHDLSKFLGSRLDVEAMARQVDSSLYRNRSTADLAAGNQPVK
jgi:hypothetical protein